MIVVHVVSAVRHVIIHFVDPCWSSRRRICAVVPDYVGMCVAVVAEDFVHIFSASVVLQSIFEGESSPFYDFRGNMFHVVLVLQHEVLELTGGVRVEWINVFLGQGVGKAGC